MTDATRPGSPSSQPPADHGFAVTSLLRRRRAIIVGLTLLGLLAGLTTTLLPETKVYRATVELGTRLRRHKVIEAGQKLPGSETLAEIGILLEPTAVLVEPPNKVLVKTSEIYLPELRRAFGDAHSQSPPELRARLWPGRHMITIEGRGLAADADNIVDLLTRSANRLVAELQPITDAQRKATLQRIAALQIEIGNQQQGLQILRTRMESLRSAPPQAVTDTVESIVQSVNESTRLLEELRATLYQLQLALPLLKDTLVVGAPSAKGKITGPGAMTRVIGAAGLGLLAGVALVLIAGLLGASAGRSRGQ